MSKDEVKDLGDHKILKAVKEQTGLTPENSNIVEAIEDAKERSRMINLLELKKAKQLAEEGKEPYPCFNAVCKEHQSDSDRHNWCATKESCHGCLFQMLSPPPNSLYYPDQYMPTHQEALDHLEFLGKLKGDQYYHDLENAKYRGKAKSQNARTQQDLGGCTIERTCDALINLLHQSKELELLHFDDDEDMLVFRQNFGVELEKALGIYPNIDLRPVEE